MPATPVTIDNCDQEPIHIPGAIQPHGMLLAFGDGDLRLRQASENAPALLGVEQGQLFQLPLESLVGEAAASVLRANQGARTWKRFNPIASELGGRKLDAVVHRSGGLVVVALEPVGLPYPASDIPAQARRLYVANPLRIIADIGYRPVGLIAAPGTAPRGPLDMTHSTLRSVSPIHIEYLRNMGVGASMSVSLVHGGKLW